MKKIVVALVALFMLSATAMAQSGDSEKKRPSKDEMAQMMTERMAKEYGLDDSQKAKLLALNKEYAGKMPMGPGGGRGPRGGDFGKGPKGGPNAGEAEPPQLTDEQKAEMKEKMEARKKEMDANRTAYEKGLKEIMTSSQYKKYQEQRSKMKPRGCDSDCEK